MRIAKEALTFDDVLLQPGYSEVLPRDVDLSTFLTRDIRLSIPLLSAAMDTVTESRFAIALAQAVGVDPRPLVVAVMMVLVGGGLAAYLLIFKRAHRAEDGIVSLITDPPGATTEREALLGRPWVWPCSVVMRMRSPPGTILRSTM